MNWPEYEIGHLASRFISGGTPSTKVPEYWDGEIPWITGADIVDGNIALGRRYINEAAIKNSATNIVPNGSLLMVTRTGVGKIALAPVDIAISQDFTGIVLKDGVEAKFALAAIRSRMGILLAAQRGATIKGVTREDVKRLTIPLPALSEQRRIVEILDQADALRKKRAEADAKASHILPALFYKMFGDPVTNPKRWPVTPFGQLGEIERGRSRHRPRNAPELLGGPYPFIQTGDVANSQGYIRTYSSTYSELGLAQSKIWPAGTLCITIAANIAATAILGFDSCFPDSVVGFTPGLKVDSAYVRVLLMFLRPIIERSAPQVAQKNINLEILRELPVPVPPKQILNEFKIQHNRALSLDENRLKSGRKLEALWVTLLHRAFAGNLTAKWRKEQLKELLVEMEQQTKALGRGGMG